MASAQRERDGESATDSVVQLAKRAAARNWHKCANVAEMARVTVQAGAALEVGDGVRAEAGAGAIERPIPLAETCVGRQLRTSCRRIGQEIWLPYTSSSTSHLASLMATLLASGTDTNLPRQTALVAN